MSAECEENPLLDFCAGEPIRTVAFDYEEDDELANLPAFEEVTPPDVLLPQINMKNFTAEEERALIFIANAVDSNGFLTITPHEAARVSQIPLPLIMDAISVMQSLEPAGLCSFTIEECLLLQLRRSGIQNPALEKIISCHLNDVANRRIKHIASALRIGSAEVLTHVRALSELNPKPLNGLVGRRPQYVVPDVILAYENHSWRAELNDNWFGNLGVSDFYAGLAKDTADAELREYLKRKTTRIRFLNNAVDRRRSTLIRMTEYLAFYQSDFLLRRGPPLPLTMTSLASKLGMHVSTVSRAARGKYIQYPCGVCEMFELFAQSLSADDPRGENPGVSSADVKKAIREMIASEDKSKPYSDNQLARSLREKEISVSRRTVAKYRLSLGIKGTHDRKY